MNQTTKKILITGATGYVGGRLLNRLGNDPRYQIRCLVRNPANLSKPSDQIEVVQGDLLDKASLSVALKDIDTAYFLVHALGAAKNFEDEERRAANNFADCAKDAGVKKIIYLGGLGNSSVLSPHLKTRHEVGQILRSSGIVTIEFRASIIIGSGSLSFELVRSLTEKLPFMITPRWVYSKAQPIAIRDILSYLCEALEKDFSQSKIYEIGGPDRVSYVGLMSEYAKIRGLKRIMIPVPFLSPKLSSLWLGLVTPVYARIGRKLIDSLINDTVVTNAEALNQFSVRPMKFSDALKLALEREDARIAETRWCDALSSAGTNINYGGVRFGSRIVDIKSKIVATLPNKSFDPIRHIGGNNGWYFANLLWKIRGVLDLLFGGVGLRRGRKHPEKIHIGDTIDFWRVEDFKESQLLRLRAEMKLPGRAWLQFEVAPDVAGSKITQTAIFDPIGLSGLLYWYALYPLHAIIFQGMLNKIAETATKVKS